MARRWARAHRNDAAIASSASLETMVVVVAVVAALYLGRAIAIPIAIAILISFSLGPVVTWLRRRRVGRVFSVVIVVVPVLCALLAFAYLVVTEIGRLADNIPAYQANVESKIAKAEAMLPSPALLQRGSTFLKGLREPASPVPAVAARQSHGKTNPPPLPGDGTTKPIQVQIENPEPSPVELLRTILGPLVDPLSDSALILLFVVFFLIERESLRDRIIRLAGSRDLHRTTMAMDEAGSRLSRYLLLQTLVNALYGSVIAIALGILGLPNAALWGALAALLRFIPYIGVAAAAVLPVALAFAVESGWGTMLWTGGTFIGLELVVGNVVEPWLYGSSTGLSAVALVLSAIFWTWLWGSIGLFLATPLTVCIAVIGRHVPQLAFLEVLLGNQAPLKPEESFYQRLLAGNMSEAMIQAEEWLKSQSLVDFLDQVALRALLLAERDRSRGELEDEHLKQVADGFRSVMTSLSAESAKSSKAQTKADELSGAVVPEDIVLCVAGQTELDHAACLLLCAALTASGRPAVAVFRDAALRLSPQDFDQGRVEAVCLSYLDADAFPHARYVARRYRRRFGRAMPLVVAFWGSGQGASRLEHLRTETGATRAVSTIAGALEAVTTDHADRVLKDGNLEPELNALAARISEVMATGVANQPGG